MKKLNFLLLTLPLLMLTQGARADILTTGDGTASSPYLISSVADLQQLSTLSNSSSWTGSAHQTAYYKLTADIDMSSVDNFEPICHTKEGADGFLGTFDGDGHVISNLNITIASNNTGHIALIGCLQSNSSGTGYVKNVILNTVTITNNYASTEAFSIGGLSGRDGSCTIENCAVLNFSISKTNNKGSNHGNGAFGYLSSSETSILKQCYTNYSVLAKKGASAPAFASNNSYVGTASQLTSGELCYLLNGSSSESPVWYQNIDSGTADNYPVLDTTHGTVYLKGNFLCDGVTSKEGGIVEYSNDPNASIVDDHTYSNGLCSVCNASVDANYLVNGKFPISNTAQMINFGKAVNNVDATLSGYLTANIDMNGQTWTGMSSFAGTFDGDNFTISNLAAPLFLTTAGDATIQNLTLEGSLTDRDVTTGAFVSTAEGNSLTITNCKNKTNLTSSVQLLGGFIGTCTCTTLNLSNCENQGSIETTDSNVGGIIGGIGEGTTNTTLTNCTNNGAVTGGLVQIGGLVGKLHNTNKVAKLTFNDCTNNGSVTSMSTGNSFGYSRVGGFIGWIRQVSGNEVIFNNSKNTGKITGSKTHAGGFVGLGATYTKVTINGCTNSGEINGTGYVGGHVGAGYFISISETSKNTGKIQATNNIGYAGGIIGDAANTTTLENCENSGTVINKHRYGGGLIGHSLLNTTIRSCTNTQEVKNTTYAFAGGLIGAVGTTSGTASAYNLTITDSENTAKVSGTNQIGGLVGRIYSLGTVEITDCANSGNISGNYSAAGMIGQANEAVSISLSNCNNTGIITTASTSEDSRGGGMIGLMYAESQNTSLTINKCWNEGTITGQKQYSGGILGSRNSLNGTVNITDCYNTGDVTDESNASAIVGNGSATINNCWNSGTVTTSFSTGTCTDCYDLNSKSDGVAQVTNDQIANGDLCYKLNGDQSTITWRQNIDNGETIDAHPVLATNGQVYQIATSGENGYYSNTATNPTLASVTLIDNENYAATTDFTASTITYSRNMSNTWGTICLPFEVKSNDEVIYYTTGEINVDVLTLTSTETVPAGTPAIFKMQNGSGTYNVTGNDVEVKSTVQTEADDLDEINLVGVFEQQIFDDVTTDNDNEYYYISNNKFMHATRKLTINPFRAYFTTAKSSTPSNGFSIAVNDDITAISALTGEGEVTVEAIYTVDGKQLRDLQQGLNIVKLSNGKVQKILVK